MALIRATAARNCISASVHRNNNQWLLVSLADFESRLTYLNYLRAWDCLELQVIYIYTHTFQSGSFQKKIVLYICSNVVLGVRLCSGIFLLLNAQMWKASISFPERIFKPSGRKSCSSKSMYKAGISDNRYNWLSEKQHEEEQLGPLVGKNLTDAQQIWGS